MNYLANVQMDTWKEKRESGKRISNIRYKVQIK